MEITQILVGIKNLRIQNLDQSTNSQEVHESKYVNRNAISSSWQNQNADLIVAASSTIRLQGNKTCPKFLNTR